MEREKFSFLEVSQFSPNYKISNVAFNPNNMVSPQPGGENYIGDYIGCSATNNIGYTTWMDS